MWIKKLTKGAWSVRNESFQGRAYKNDDLLVILFYSV